MLYVLICIYEMKVRFNLQIAKLQRHIEEVASRESYMGEQMPIKWLKFEQLVNQLVEDGARFTSLDQVS